uniref:Globoside alpha-1,3-N-acetylgalactosaminyltransferase 1-like n=1 Tax=Oryzias melastigma TaxID=30732 RepID=A0A3B3BEJ5_ORYME
MCFFMLRASSKIYCLVSFISVLILLWAFYLYSQDSVQNRIGLMCNDNTAAAMKTHTYVVEVKRCSNKDSWSVGNLLMPTGLTYSQPNTQRGYTRFLKGFLETSEKYFLTGFRVTYYIFTDSEKDIPAVPLGEGRNITVLPVPAARRWQEVVFGRMKWATITIDKQIRNETDYLFLMDVDSLFYHRFGAESFSRLSAVLHRGYYKKTERVDFPYERRPESRAYIPFGEGDYYYTAAVLGGYLEDMYNLVRYCYEQSEEDASNNIEAVWQEESHLNKYLLYNKPTKVLSPEYLWSDYDRVPADIKVVRISQLKKNYKEVRPNGGH